MGMIGTQARRSPPSCSLASPTHYPARTWVRPSTMSDSEATSTGGESTSPSSVPSPELFKLSLAELTEENKERAATIKKEANAAFVGRFYPVIPLCNQQSLDLESSLLDESADADFGCFSFFVVPQLMSSIRPRIFTVKLWIKTHSMLRYGVIGRMRGSSWRNTDML